MHFVKTLSPFTALIAMILTQGGVSVAPDGSVTVPGVSVGADGTSGNNGSGTGEEGDDTGDDTGDDGFLDGFLTNTFLTGQQSGPRTTTVEGANGGVVFGGSVFVSGNNPPKTFTASGWATTLRPGICVSNAGMGGGKQLSDQCSGYQRTSGHGCAGCSAEYYLQHYE